MKNDSIEAVHWSDNNAVVMKTTNECTGVNVIFCSDRFKFT